MKQMSAIELKRVGKLEDGSAPEKNEVRISSNICQVLEVITVAVTIFLVWLLFLLPALFYHIEIKTVSKKKCTDCSEVVDLAHKCSYRVYVRSLGLEVLLGDFEA